MRNLRYLLPAAVAVVLFSCNKSKEIPYYDTPTEIVLIVDDENSLHGSVETKTSEISSVPGALYWGATTGSGGSQSTKWSSAYSGVSGGAIYTGRYQTASATSYNYYISNVNMSIGANTTVYATNDTDVVVGYTAGSSSTNPSVNLYHVFARTGSISITTTNGTFYPSSYSIAGYSSINGTAGTYNIRTGEWSSVSQLGSTGISSSSDYYLIPGTYTISVYGTYVRGDYSWTGTKSGTVTLTGGKVNNISMTWPDMGTEIVVSVSLTGWSSQTVNGSVS